MVLRDEVDKYIRFFSKQNYDFTQMAIIVNGGYRSTSVIRRELSSRLSTEYPINLKVKSSNAQRSGESFIIVNEKLLGIYDYDYVSSSEWPVVILASCCKFLVDNFDYPTYRAATRATGKLICISVAYSE